MEYNNAHERKNPDKDIEFTTYDRLLRAWENTMELVRDFENYSKSVDHNVRDMFKRFAEDEGRHAAELKKVILEYRERENGNINADRDLLF